MQYRNSRGRLTEHKIPQAKLSPEQATEIRRLYRLGTWTQSDLGRRYGVAQTHISRIVRGDKWAHLLPARIQTEEGQGNA